MSMRCSLLGHSYGDEEEARTEKGDAGAVEVSKRVQVCDRCDHERVVSENKTVRANSPDEPSAESVESEQAVATDGGPGDDLAHGYDVETNDAIIMGSGDDDESIDADETAEDEANAEAKSESETTEGTVVDSENGVAIIEEGPGKTDLGAEDASVDDETDDDDRSVATTGGAVIITDGPGSSDDEAESEDEGESTDVVDDTPAPEPTEEATNDVPDEATSIDGGGDALVWSGNTSSSDAAQETADPTPEDSSTPEASTEKSRAERRKERQERLRTNMTQARGTDTNGETEGARVVCSDCGFSAAQRGVTVVPGDACPDCRVSFLTGERGD